jgi:hypothetical protein
MERQQSQPEAASGNAPAAPQQYTISLVLRLQGLPPTATSEKLAALLESKQVPFKGCKVDVNPISKVCESSLGEVAFPSRAACKEPMS